ncbi:hypothetical protein N0O92_21265 [Alkalihalobacillus sp. MEB130]|uniref:hypothetical protein n=1 Tax=Alkalihalobacillus sp. MEB130 TaxID=2976704 RepID=UPI0028E09308|nr:hypothetical protein [Alkalihalobacillus sp. MEB130]MDT8862723.1 hypothetical protein [Alkalihalobacillus sp. MEB130]
MSKIQIMQIFAVVVLLVFVYVSYQNDATVTWIFYALVIVNVVLWILRLKERRKQDQEN